MALTRRELLRRLGGVSILAGLFAGSRIYLQDQSPEPRSRLASPADDPGPARTTGADRVDPTSHDHETTASDSTSAQPPEVEASLELVGEVGPLTIPEGALAAIVGDVVLTGDLTVEGTLTGIDSFTLDGNGYQILAQRGGRIQLLGLPKTGWTRVGSEVAGWNRGDRLVIAPTAVGAYTPTETVWEGDWQSVASPPAVALLDGRTITAEVANLTRSITLKNLARLMLHEGAGPSEFRHIALVDCGTPELGFYPLHFHMNGETVSGSMVEGVVVEGGRNRAFVPHASHGIRFLDCVAYKTVKRPYWWDEEPANESHDISYQKCLAMHIVAGPDGEEKKRLAGFQLGLARRSSVVGCAVVGVQGEDDSGGFWWPGGQSLSPWDFRDNVSHNNVGHGFIIWQNTDEAHFLADSVAYRNSRSGVDHGAYRNPYTYRNMVLQENATGIAVTLHANAREQGQLYENIRTDGMLMVNNHTQPPAAIHRHVNATYTAVVYEEKGQNPSHQEFIDCDLSPDDFDLSGIHPESTISIEAAGKVIARWSRNIWS